MIEIVITNTEIIDYFLSFHYIPGFDHETLEYLRNKIGEEDANAGKIDYNIPTPYGFDYANVKTWLWEFLNGSSNEIRFIFNDLYKETALAFKIKFA